MIIRVTGMHWQCRSGFRAARARRTSGPGSGPGTDLNLPGHDDPSRPGVGRQYLSFGAVNLNPNLKSASLPA